MLRGFVFCFFGILVGFCFVFDCGRLRLRVGVLMGVRSLSGVLLGVRSLSGVLMGVRSLYSSWYHAIVSDGLKNTCTFLQFLPVPYFTTYPTFHLPSSKTCTACFFVYLGIYVPRSMIFGLISEPLNCSSLLWGMGLLGRGPLIPWVRWVDCGFLDRPSL